MEHVAGPVDDGLEQLVPRPGGRRQAGDLVQEAQLLELVVGAPRRHRRRVPARRAGGRRTRIAMVVTGITIQAYGKVAARKVAVRWRLGTRNGPAGGPP